MLEDFGFKEDCVVMTQDEYNALKKKNESEAGQETGTSSGCGMTCFSRSAIQSSQFLSRRHGRCIFPRGAQSLS